MAIIKLIVPIGEDVFLERENFHRCRKLLCDAAIFYFEAAQSYVKEKCWSDEEQIATLMGLKVVVDAARKLDAWDEMVEFVRNLQEEIDLARSIGALKPDRVDFTRSTPHRVVGDVVNAAQYRGVNGLREKHWQEAETHAWF